MLVDLSLVFLIEFGEFVFLKPFSLAPLGLQKGASLRNLFHRRLRHIFWLIPRFDFDLRHPRRKLGFQRIIAVVHIAGNGL